MPQVRSMASFIRFVFAIVVAGVTVNLAIVLVANVRSSHRQARQYRQDVGRFKDLIGDIGGHVRRADLIVESQRLDGHDHPLETRLLVRQYRATGTSQNAPLPVVRVTIPGNQLQATGLMLEFDNLFAPENPDYEVLRNTQLAFFGMFCGADEPAPSSPGAPDTRFTFLPRFQVPDLIRLDPLAGRPSTFESGLWQYLWNALPEPPRDAKFPWVSVQPGAGVKGTWLKPATIAVRRSHTYTAYVSSDGIITLGEDEPGMTDLMDVMEREAKNLPN
jgi:hypothetical protein